MGPLCVAIFLALIIGVRGAAKLLVLVVALAAVNIYEFSVIEGAFDYPLKDYVVFTLIGVVSGLFSRMTFFVEPEESPSIDFGIRNPEKH